MRSSSIARTVAASLFAAAGLLATSMASAQTPAYPTRPVRLVLAFGPGGSVDVVARLLGAKVGESLGQALIIENKPGADADLAGETVARATPDGYTVLLTSQALAVNASLHPRRSYKIEDLAPVMLLAETQAVLTVPIASEAKSVTDLIAMAKAQPGKLDYGSTGTGTSGHLAMELFRITAGIDIVHVPFRNTGQWTIDMIAGRIALGMPTVPGATAHIKGGKLRALGVSGKSRSMALPDVPTVAEAGLPGYATSTWYPLLVPRGTPKPIIDRIHAAFSAAVEDPTNKVRLVELGVEPVLSTPDELGRHIASEVERWANVVRQAGIKAE
jgi:tripartite-type tricarboxylate transporter receptor subunit TctC